MGGGGFGDSLVISRQSACWQINILRYVDSQYVDSRLSTFIPHLRCLVEHYFFANDAIFIAIFWPKHIIRFLQNTGQLCTQLVLRSPNYSLWLLDHQRFARCLNQFPFKPPNLDIGTLSMELRWMALALVWFLGNFTDQDWKKILWLLIFLHQNIAGVVK